MDRKIGAFIIPTGIGAKIGGYAGDGSLYARKISERASLIVNPNVVNAACFSGITENMLYVEGFTLDEFFKGKCSLSLSRGNKIGIVFDKSISQNVLNIHINTINAVKTVYGIDIIGYEVTEDEVGVEFFVANNISTGCVENISALDKATEKLLSRGAEAIAVVCGFPEEEINENYKNGIGVDAVGGVEGIISHYLSKKYKIPTAHSPAFEDYSVSTEVVSPKSAAEYITPTFLPCVLIGLNNAPKIEQYSGINADKISVEDLDFLIMPFNSLGCVPVMEAIKRNIRVFAVRENETLLNVDLSVFKSAKNIILVETYQDCLSFI